MSLLKPALAVWRVLLNWRKRKPRCAVLRRTLRNNATLGKAYCAIALITAIIVSC